MDTMDPQPKALKYTETAAAVEQKIAAALPEMGYNRKSWTGG
jgi:hypothetical protein